MELKEFIEKNKLDFSGEGSNLNGNCVILAGYALHKGFEDSDDVDVEICKDEAFKDIWWAGAIDEFDRVFDYAKDNNYGDFWKTKEAKEKYIF